jgi:hypothetical protein
VVDEFWKQRIRMTDIKESFECSVLCTSFVLRWWEAHGSEQSVHTAMWDAFGRCDEERKRGGFLSPVSRIKF